MEKGYVPYLQQWLDGGVKVLVIRDNPFPISTMPSVPVADLTNYFCTEVCSPVIGRAMVYVDGSHITQTFARTLAPYLYPFVRKTFAHSPN